MSNDENSNEIIKEAAEEVVNKAEESVNETVENVSDTTENVASKVTALKESNPKLFYGGIGAIVLIILAVMIMGGDNKQLPAAKVINLAIGQTYSLKGVNTYDPDATVRLVAVPGSIAAYDDTEEEDRVGDCKHMPQGTKVKLIQIQEAFGKAKFVEVEMLDGECAGRKGWAVSNNLD